MDYSFLRFSKNINESLEDSPMAQVRYRLSIMLKPSEIYQQITNVPDGISLDEDLIPYIVDCEGKELLFIGDNFFYTDFTAENGTKQYRYSFGLIDADYGHKPVRLRLSRLESDDVYYSNPFVYTEQNASQSILFQYYNLKSFKGISYERANGFQSIRLGFYFDKLENKTESDDYYQLTTGNTINTKAHIKMAKMFKSDMIDNFTFERLNLLLNHDNIFIDGFRCTNKPALKDGSRKDFSNYFESEFLAFIDKSDAFSETDLTFQELAVTSLSPQGLYTLLTVPLMATIVFNKNIKVIAGGLIRLYNTAGTLIHTHTTISQDNSSNFYTFAFSGANANTDYYFTVEPLIIRSAVSTELFVGFNNSTTWTFSLRVGDYDKNDYSDLDYFVTD